MRYAAGAALALALLAGGPAAAQPSSLPPAVGVVAVTRQPILQSSDYIGRIQATNRVHLVARVAASLEEVLFTEGAEVRKGDLLYRLEQVSFRADVKAKEAAVAQLKAQLTNAQATLARAQALLRTPAGQQSTVDTATANEQALQAQVLGAEAQLEQARINLDYTEIRAPIDGKIGRTAVTTGNYVNTGTGTLVTIVSQDPMYVVFPVPTRTVIDMRRRQGTAPDIRVIRIRLPDGRIYDQAGRLDFVDNTVTGTTDTMILRGMIANPLLHGAGGVGTRELVDGELVTVILQDPQPTEVLTVPRAAILTDQGGDYVYVVGSDNKAQQRRVRLGQSSPEVAAVMSGLDDGESVVVEGVQRVRAGQPVSPGPVSPKPAAATPRG